MAAAVVQPATQRYALITGANKGIGFQICRQLASLGIVVILASRDANRGIKSRFGRLDILVNNAGILGVDVNGDASVLEEYIIEDFKNIAACGQAEPFHPKASGKLIHTLKSAKECIETNYYGAKRVTEALIPLLQQSDSPRIVNVSSSLGSLVLQTNEWAKEVFSSKESLTEDKIDKVVQEFLRDFKEGKLEEKQWPPHLAAYKVSKEAMNAYTWLVAKNYPSLCINSVCPGFTRTDITLNYGLLSEVEAAESPVKMALLPDGGPSGRSFHRWEALAL